MHESSFLKMQLFMEMYGSKAFAASERPTVLEVGSKRYHDQPSYRDFIVDERFNYTGLDLEAGENVDVVPQNAYLWQELSDEAFDICISGQTFEHNPYFWITMCEISRILKPGGYCCIIVPGAGPVHRYPLDCWRFYPDSWAALCHIAGLDIIETFFETDRTSQMVLGGYFRDSCVIATRPRRDAVEAENLKRRLSDMTRHFTAANTAFDPQPFIKGPCFERYERELANRPTRGRAHALFRKVVKKRGSAVFDPEKNL